MIVNEALRWQPLLNGKQTTQLSTIHKYVMSISAHHFCPMHFLSPSPRSSNPKPRRRTAKSNESKKGWQVATTVSESEAELKAKSMKGGIGEGEDQAGKQHAEEPPNSNKSERKVQVATTMCMHRDVRWMGRKEQARNNSKQRKRTAKFETSPKKRVQAANAKSL